MGCDALRWSRDAGSCLVGQFLPRTCPPYHNPVDQFRRRRLAFCPGSANERPLNLVPMDISVSLICASRLFDGRGDLLEDAGVAFRGEHIIAVGSRADL